MRPNLLARVSTRALLAALATALALATCAEPRRAERASIDTSVSRVDVFLRTDADVANLVHLTLSAVRLRNGAGDLLPLELRRDTVSSRDAARRIPIAGSPLEAGSYRSVVLSIERASLERGGGRVPLTLISPQAGDSSDAAARSAASPDSPVECEIPIRLELHHREAASIFLEWNVPESIDSGLGFSPSFVASLEMPQSRLGLLYVADAATDSVLSVSRSSSEVVGTTRVGPRPKGVAISADRRRLFVANSGDGSLSILDTQSNSQRFNFPIRLSAETCDVVEADGGRLAAAVNSGLDSVTLMDVASTALVAHVRVGRAPIRLANVERSRRLFVVNSRSDDVSVVDLASRSVIASIPVESSPSDVAADRDGRNVFVVHRVSRNLLVIDADTLAIKSTIYVGDDASAVLADRRSDRVYVARGTPHELVVVDARLGSVVRRVAIGGRIEALAQPIEGSRIYGAAPALGSLLVIDPLLGREEAPIPCGQSPVDVVAVE